jgi:predicted nucleotidyltransferase
MILGRDQYEETISRLKEREKEIKCLYKVQGIINDNLPVDKFLMQISQHIWGGWQFPNITRAKIIFENKIFKEPGWTETKWFQYSDIIIDDKVCGRIEVYYTEFKRLVRDSQFLPEEQKLLDTIAAKISTYIFNQRLVKTLEAFDDEQKNGETGSKDISTLLPDQPDIHWIWRYEMVKKIAEKLDFVTYGVKAMYLIGSVKNATSGPASDIDIMLHFTGDEHQKKELKAWFEGWSLCLSEINQSKTGYKTCGLIDLHLITDKDIEMKNSFATMIGSLNNSAKLIKKWSDD